MTDARKPARLTGRARPDPHDDLAQARAERAQEFAQTVWIDTDGQRAVLNTVRRHMRVCQATRRRKGASITGLRLSQHSQAGKSAVAEQLLRELEAEAVAAGREPNPYRVIHINMDQRMTLKMLFQEILNRLGDNFIDEPGARGLRVTAAQAAVIRGKPSDTIKVLEQRIEEWVRRLGVELIIVDEIQRLVTRPEDHADPCGSGGTLTADAMDVTKKLQAFLDRGVVPLFLIGDEHSPKFFQLNEKFAVRLGRPLKLQPLDIGKTSDRRKFHDFCLEYDRLITSAGITSMPTCLTQPDVLTALITAAGGHIGRASRIIGIALPAAMERGAVTLEAYDLSNAVRDFARELGWVGADPFSMTSAATASGEPFHAA